MPPIEAYVRNGQIGLSFDNDELRIILAKRIIDDMHIFSFGTYQADLVLTKPEAYRLYKFLQKKLGSGLESENE